MSAQGATALEIHFASLHGFLTRYLTCDTSPLTLLDFGCGRVGYVNLYKQHFGRCLALDVVDYSANYDDVEFLLSGGLDIPLPDRSVDVVVSHSTLEHVEDIECTIGEINRVLIEGGHAYLTVSPLYFSQGGGHLRVGPDSQRLSDWEHLDPASPYYRGVDGEARTRRGPRQNRRNWLNGLTTEMFLAAVGKQPWDILAHRIKAQHDKPLPAFLRAGDLSRVDLYTKEFRMVARKSFSVVEDEIVLAPPLA